MGIELEVTGNGHFAGSKTNLIGYSVVEDATPIDPNDSTGGVGQISFSVNEDTGPEGTILLLNDTVELRDGSNGKTTGTVSSVSAGSYVANVTADSRLGKLIADVQAAPITGTLEDAFRYYLSLGGITAGIVIDPTIASRAVTYGGFHGNLWDNMRQMCAAQQIELSLVSNNVVLRPLRTRVAENLKRSEISWSAQNGDLAKSIEIYRYENQYKTDTLVYPKGGWDDTVQVFSVDAGSVIEQDIEIGVSLLSVQQPVYVASVARFYSGPTSVYTASGNDGYQITPAQWNATGGSLTVSINPDTTSIHVTIVGPDIDRFSPYSIGMPSGPSNYYSALRIVGTGVHQEKILINIPTGADPSKATQDVGVTIDNPFIDSVAKAYTAGSIAASKYAGPQQSIEFTNTVINRKGDKGSTTYPTYDDFTAEYVGKTYDDFTAEYVGKDYNDFQNDLLLSVQDDFVNQAFGNVAGARVLFRQAWYRIRSATTTQNDISVSAERDTTYTDFEGVWSGKTYSDFTTRFIGKSYNDFGVIPLWS